MSAHQALVEIFRDEKNKATVNLFGRGHGQLLICKILKWFWCITVAGATLVSWIHDETEMIFVRCVM